ncbi:helix-turn-helix transcriptional regulator [Streptomyces sp. ISL-22]|uniref:helix-turn-helix domain-containing protein n=1 Tax=unclassified Streptomyces TaxID=2593676 RepID=UPI001BEB0C74|nr:MULTISPECIES: helix-turn-helix transcriptional regulator [unclassified Streptomyces]MBT2421881.1 helix-turn-helix transcriptional regulator [Streptomyces sp. ISL-24]MBT2433431.1 helix-turn-helix transcriptional regulator [Streptomyces sp. ISL-22]
MEQIQCQSGLTTEELVRRIGVDPTRAAAVLSGSRFPSRRLTIRFARACGADHHILLKVWDDEHERRCQSITHRADGTAQGATTGQ